MGYKGSNCEEGSTLDIIIILLLIHSEYFTQLHLSSQHILLEKPVAVSAAEFSLMIEVCRENGVLLMDGTMFMHHKRFESLMSTVCDPIVGRISMVRASFSFNGTNERFLGGNIRTSASGDPLGCVGDLGWYCIRFGIMIFAQRKLSEMSRWVTVPRIASARLVSGTDEGVPLECEARVGFSSKDSENPWERVLVFDCSFLQPFRQKAEVSILGHEGVHDKVISLDDFVIPRSENSASFISETTSGLVNCATQVLAVRDEVTDLACKQEVRMFEIFDQMARTNDHAQRDSWRELSAMTQAVVDACMLSLQRAGDPVLVTLR